MPVKKYLILFSIIALFSTDSFSQFRIRLLADQPSDVIFFSVTNGTYKIQVSQSQAIEITKGESAILTKTNNRLAVKTQNRDGFICDSVEFLPGTEGSTFSLRRGNDVSLRRIYNGVLVCKNDLGSVMLINITDPEDYFSGVVKAEGGGGLYPEFFKTQAVIVRTYAFKYRAKHLKDGFNLCDGTHCQVYTGLTTDTAILAAVAETRDEVIVDKDSVLIISAFHSNCGGETAASEDVWLTYQPYLISVTDPYCTTSRNATWEKKITLPEWKNYLVKNGFSITDTTPSIFNFKAYVRKPYYTIGTFKWPANQIRSDFSLRSTFFSVTVTGDAVLFNGRGYGHGVGLCQEGAIAMAGKGIDYKSIIRFYYTGVNLTGIESVKETAVD